MRWRTALALVTCLGLAPLLASRADDTPAKRPDPKAAAKAETFEVPYRLTDTNHLMVRTKINGKGPFNLIVDTGAPAVFITKGVAKKAKAEEGEKGWVSFDSFELEGGLKVKDAKGRIEDLIQLDGMNGMGLAGVELHGVIGYNVLAKYRIEYDLTSDRLVFEPLNFDPPPLLPLGGKGNEGIQSMGPMVKMLTTMLGIKPNFDTVPRGFTGIEYEEKDGKVFVKAVLAGSPAEKAGLKPGDRITSIKTDSIDSAKDLTKALAKAGVGTKWRFYITRDGKDDEVVVELGKGL
ncbi:PDZ domain-containing protein [Gemmata sp. JC717]|uniref:PDZ domain-containing protein n=1 Tax=Gemmata algarum TaxID=2975278 RepID=UPI0021BA8E6A|nr:PDZ domain-containing protein [Gemmata algarum]MDY3553716.1 PDZ domain-containing protein [Gemmata algarum]